MCMIETLGAGAGTVVVPQILRKDTCSVGRRAHHVGSSALLISFGLSIDALGCDADVPARDRPVLDHATVGLSLAAF